MSMRRLSPTANLLRTSRLFSLPPPLPRPSSDLTATANFESDTSTLPYPTHAAIETTDSSLSRGDWGLKRALPLKSTTRTSTPTINIDNIDSIDHITDFNSAADHVLTLRKWQEMYISFSMAERRTLASRQLQNPPRSVFESKHDNTHSDETDPNQQRWKYKGPWLASKTEGAFEKYIKKDVKRRKMDFKRFLRKHLAEMKAVSRRREATESGEDPEESDVDRVSEDELEAYIKRLRKDDITMRKILEEYLDLPRELGSQGISASTFTYDKQGPPTTHPSAGLSYTRTGAHVFNHPILGPQEENTPIESRVIRPQTSKQVKYDRALLGLGGVVAEDDKLAFTLADEEQGLGNYDPDIPGGTKLWVRPITASVDSRGRITIATRRATPNAVNVAKGFYSQGAEPPAAALAAARDRETPVLTRPRQASARGSPGYGVESMASVNSSGRAAPFSGPDDKPPDFRRLLAGNSQRNI